HDHAWCLDDLVGITQDVRHHRAWQPARDAALPQGEIVCGVERAAAETTAGSQPHVEDAVDARIERWVDRPETSQGFGCHRWDLAVGRIDNQPRTAAFRHFERVAKLKRADAGRTRQDLLLALDQDALQLLASDVLNPA